MFICQMALSQTSNSLSNFEAELRQLKDMLKIPGLSYAVVKDQELLHAGAMGWADRERKIPATKKTLYSIASLTKTFTSTILFQLAEQGKLNLDEPISKYDNSIKGDSLKVYHFLTHTSEGKPGTKYRYNGDRFALLQSVIEKITGKSYREVLEENILSKIKMKESIAGQDVLEDESKYKSYRKLLAKPYTLYGEDEMVLSPYPPKKITASAGLLSNVTDLVKYDIALDKHLFLSTASQEKAWQLFVLSDGSLSPYGYGWFVQKVGEKKMVWHYGQWSTYSSLYIKLPEQNISLIILANSDGLSRPFSLGSGNLLNSPFALAFLRHFVKHETGSKTSVQWMRDSTEFYTSLNALQASHPNANFAEEQKAYQSIQRYLLTRKSRVRQVSAVDPQIFKDYVGKYELLPVPLIISVVDNSLMAEGPLLNSKVQLFPETDTKFFLKILNAQVEFYRNEQNVVTGCNLYIDGTKYQCMKLE